MYSRCYFLMIGRHREQVCRCIGDVMRHWETSRVLQENSMHALNFFAMHTRRFVRKKDRRCIADASGMLRGKILSSGMHPRIFGDASAMHRRSIRDPSGFHPRIFVKHIWGICILQSLAVHTCVDTRIEKACQLLHRRCLFPSGTITSMMAANASPKHPRSIPEQVLAALRCPLRSIGIASRNGTEA